MTASQHRLQTNVAAPRASRRRAAVILTAAAAVVLALVVGLVVVLVPSTPTAAPLPGPAPAAPDAGGDGWDLAAQTELATRPMPSLPQRAALPQPLSADSAGPPIRLPSPDSRDGLVPRGFPPTAEGALAQLAALTAAGLVNADPDAYAAAYTAVAAPGAPAVEATPLHRGLVEIRARSGLRTTGAVPGLTFSWTPGGGLIKGSTDRGRYVVACVIGQLDSGANGQILSTGAGDCQALRFV
ncbi:MAG TPA: hypothetical protein VF256_09790, partial [Streptosporangiaceae bacterium]